MLDSHAQTMLMQRYPMLRSLSAAKQDNLLTDATRMHLPAGTVIFDENQPCQGFPFLFSGIIRVIKAAANGRELHLYRVGPGESCILSSACLLGHASYPARGLVDQDVEMVVLTPAAFRTLLSEHEPFRDYIFSLFSKRLTDLMQLVSVVAFQKLDQRLAALLITKPNPVHATHQSLADELGSVREIVSRLLKNFSEQGWVKMGREKIEILNVSALKNLAQL